MARKIIGLTGKVKVFGLASSKTLMGRNDTGAVSSAIDLNLAKKLKLGPVISKKRVRSTAGQQIRPVIKAKLKLAGKELIAKMTIADRSKMKYKILIGQNVLKRLDVYIDPTEK